MIRNAIAPIATRMLSTRFDTLHGLSAQERSLLDRVEVKPSRSFPSDTRLLAEGAVSPHPFIILSGWAYRARSLQDGRRQIVGLLVPGDLVGFHPWPQPISFTSVYALGRVRTVDASDMLSAWRGRTETPGLGAAVDMALAEEQYFLTTHIMRLGRQMAVERMANLIMELDYRLSTRGMSTQGGFAMPATQEILADVLGLSIVHINRTLQLLRRRNLIELQRGKLIVKNPEEMRALGEFKPPFVSSAYPPRVDDHYASASTPVAH